MLRVEAARTLVRARESFACRLGSVALALAASVAATPASAMLGEQVQLELRGTVEPKCQFTTSPNSGELGVLKSGLNAELGTLGFRCNLPDSPQVNLTIRSDNGGMRREGGSEVVPYTAAWQLPGAGNFVNAADFQNQLAFSSASGDIKGGQSGVFKIQVGDGGELVAGTYRDRITFTISP